MKAGISLSLTFDRESCFVKIRVLSPVIDDRACGLCSPSTHGLTDDSLCPAWLTSSQQLWTFIAVSQVWSSSSP